MATSGSTNYSVTASNVITEALELIGVLEAGGTVTANDEASCLRTLNLMVKQWSANFDFAPGLKAFCRKRGYMFLQSGQSSYSLGPSGDNATLAYVTTTVRVAATTSATTIEVGSTTGMTNSDYIGIELDSGAIQWSVLTITDSDTLTIPATGLTSAASAGNRIFTYTTKLVRPLYIESAVLRDTSGSDSPLYPMTPEFYEGITNKGEDADAAFYLYENALTNGRLQLDTEPDDVTKVVRLTFMAPVEDLDAVANDIAYPQEWFSAIAIGLAKRVAPKFGHPWGQDMESQYMEALSMARGSYADTSEDYFQPGLE